MHLPYLIFYYTTKKNLQPIFLMLKYNYEFSSESHLYVVEASGAYAGVAA